MGADRTLVEGAYRAAMAKVPGDYSKLYWQEMMEEIQFVMHLRHDLLRIYVLHYLMIPLLMVELYHLLE